MRDSQSTIPIAIAGGLAPTTERRAKRIGGAPFIGLSYRKAKAAVAGQLADALRRWGISQRRFASAAGVNQRLVQAWIDAEGANGLRLDVALTVALDGSRECRAAVVDVLRSVLALAEGSLVDR